MTFTIADPTALTRKGPEIRFTASDSLDRLVLGASPGRSLVSVGAVEVNPDLRRLLLVVGATVFLAGGCSSGGETAPGEIFAMSREEIAAASVTPMAVAINVAEGLYSGDADLFGAQFTPEARVTDPVIPGMRPTVSEFFTAFRGLCSWEYEEVFVNERGSLTRGACVGLLDAVVGAPSSPGVVRHMQMQDDLSTGWMHRVEAEILGTYPKGFVEAIGAPSLGLPNLHLDAADQAEQAGRFEESFVRAWNSGNSEEIVALYAADAIRQDGFAGLMATPEEFLAWLEAIYGIYDTVTVTVERLYASGFGPAAFYRLDATGDDKTCTMRIGSIWNLSPDDLITYEQVFYDPDTIFECGWGD